MAKAAKAMAQKIPKSKKNKPTNEPKDSLPDTPYKLRANFTRSFYCLSCILTKYSDIRMCVAR
jgi:hypothetical protein